MRKGRKYAFSLIYPLQCHWVLQLPVTWKLVSRTRATGLPDGEKPRDPTVVSFDALPACDGQSSPTDTLRDIQPTGAAHSN